MLSFLKALVGVKDCRNNEILAVCSVVRSSDAKRCGAKRATVRRFLYAVCRGSEETKFQLNARQFWAIVIMTFPSEPLSKFQIISLTLRFQFFSRPQLPTYS